MRRPLIWLATVAWWSIVLFSSGEGASAEFTRQLLRALFGFEGGALDLANLILRKFGHVMYYAILTGLLTRSFRNVGGAVAIAAGTAIFDEGRQTLFTNRTGTAVDLLYDGMGILIAVLILSRCAKSDSRSRRG